MICARDVVAVVVSVEASRDDAAPISKRKDGSRMNCNQKIVADISQHFLLKSIFCWKPRMRVFVTIVNIKTTDQTDCDLYVVEWERKD